MITFARLHEVVTNAWVGKVLSTALQARTNAGVCDRSRFGDCRETAQEAIRLLAEWGVKAQLDGGQFICNEDDEVEFDHSWVRIGSLILDPTVDQFYSDLDIDLKTRMPGVYFSHPECDGDSLTDRYRNGLKFTRGKG